MSKNAGNVPSSASKVAEQKSGADSKSSHHVEKILVIPIRSKTGGEVSIGDSPPHKQRNGYSFGNGVCVEEELPKTRVLIPRERMLVPAKKATDQPLVSYDIDSDDEVSSFHKDVKNKKDQGASSKLLRDGFDIDLDDSGSDDLDLIPPPPPPRKRCFCVKPDTSCSVQ